MTDNITKVGIGVVLMKGTSILLGRRKGSHGEGQWAFPGGHMEYLESFEQTARRELAEGVGSQVQVRDLRVASVINLTEYTPKHYIDIGMYAQWVSGDPVVMEPEKCAEWVWFDLAPADITNFTDFLPSPRFATIDRTLQAMFDRYVTGANLAKVYDVDNESKLV